MAVTAIAGEGKKASADRRNDPDGCGSRIVPLCIVSTLTNMVGVIKVKTEVLRMLKETDDYLSGQESL